VLDRKTVGVPTKTALDVVTLHGPISRNDVLDSTGEKVAIVRQASCEWRAIVECVVRATFGEFDLEAGDGLEKPSLTPRASLQGNGSSPGAERHQFPSSAQGRPPQSWESR
jgi:hypothetical protein